MGQKRMLPTGLALGLVTAGCSQASPPPAVDTPSTVPSAASAPHPAAFVWPADLRVMGEGFPRAGDPCRRLGESARTSNYLDDSSVLVGCPGSATEAASRAVLKIPGSRSVGAAEGVTFISIPLGDANAGMQAAADTSEGETGA